MLRMEYRGIVRGFSAYTEAQLLQMKQDLALEMSPSLLAHCASYYKQMRRDPAIAELQLLDRFHQSNRLTPSNCAITELLTDQESVALTYHDLLKKRAELIPNANHPCTPEEAFYAATAYINRGGKNALLSQKQLTLGSCSPFYKAKDWDHYVFSPDENSYLQITPKEKDKKPRAGDILTLLTSEKPQRKGDYLASVHRLLEHPKIQSYLIGQSTVNEKGLLDTALSLAKNGLWIELSRLSKVEEYVPISMLFNGYEGDVALRLSAQAPKFLTELASAVGLRISIFATVTNDGDLRVSNQEWLDFRVSLPFLHSLVPNQGIGVTLPEECNAPLCVQFEKSQNKSLAYLPYLQEKQFSSTYIEGTVTAVAQSAPEKNFFLHGIYTALTPVLTLALSGCDYPSQRLSLQLNIPADLTAPESVGSTLSMILGVYRVQAEYGIPAAAIRMTSVEGLRAPRFTAYSTGVGTPCPLRFIREKSHVYLIRMGITENGAPDFEEIRKNMALLTDLRQQEILQSAMVLCGRSVTQGLEAMAADGIRCHIKNQSTVSQEQEYFSLLLETTQPIPAIYIGSTVKKAASRSSDSRISPSSPQQIWAERPEILLLSCPGDSAVSSLACELEQAGAHVRIFSDTPADGNAFSRALLGSHVLVLCGNPRVTETDAIRFAYQTFRTAGGKVISVGAPHSVAADDSFPEGFEKADIEKLASFEEKKEYF